MRAHSADLADLETLGPWAGTGLKALCSAQNGAGFDGGLACSWNVRRHHDGNEWVADTRPPFDDIFEEWNLGKAPPVGDIVDEPAWCEPSTLSRSHLQSCPFASPTKHHVMLAHPAKP